MKFEKYPTLDNLANSSVRRRIEQEGLLHTECVVQEKVHGANLSFWVKGQQIKIAKRTGFLGTSEEFFGYQKLSKDVEPKIMALSSALEQEIEHLNWFVLYGEIFGGGYPHPDVSPEPLGDIVQKGLYYCPGLEFYGFDIMVSTENTGRRRFLDFDRVSRLLEDHGFIQARPLFRGSFEACCDHSNRFRTTIPDQFGLPPIEDNFCEGIVIRSVEPIDDEAQRWIRVKDKNERWQEYDAKKHQELRKGLSKDKRLKKLDDDARALFAEILSLITENRLSNVLSHLGPVKGKSGYKSLRKSFRRDVLDEARVEHDEALLNLEDGQRILVLKLVDEEIDAFLKKTRG